MVNLFATEGRPKQVLERIALEIVPGFKTISETGYWTLRSNECESDASEKERETGDFKRDMIIMAKSQISFLSIISPVSLK